jgi:hypothetical protein
MNCSVNIYTRRPARLKQTIKSILDTANNPSDIEFVLRYDNDDADSANAMPEICSMAMVKAISGPPLGYAGYPVANWQMCKQDDGDWIWHFDDDATVMETSKGWDEKLRRAPRNKLVVPEWNILGGSGYHMDSSCPFFFLPNRWWQPYGIKEFTQPFDTFVQRTLVDKYHWDIHYILGLSTFHERIREDPLNLKQNRF